MIHVILTGSILLLVSCTNKVDIEILPTDPVVNISVPDLVFSENGNKTSSFTITTDAPWTITFSNTKSAPDWCQVEPKNGNAGTCWIYSNNASIAYCPLIDFDSEYFAQIIHHEAVGHGFGKLADEYSYASTGKIPQSNIDYYKQWEDIDNSWWNNIDFTDDPSKIKWSLFLSNPLYATTVGIYEGAATYKYGAYRPSENSIMRHNVGEFNAPSRLALYKRILLLSGEKYNYDTFLEYDHINRTSIRSASTMSENFIPFAPPVVITE